jgi:hypothetical protein
MSDIVKAFPSNNDLASGIPSFRNLAALWRSKRGAKVSGSAKNKSSAQTPPMMQLIHCVHRHPTLSVTKSPITGAKLGDQNSVPTQHVNATDR